MMLRYIIPLIGSMAPLWNYVLFIVLALAFVATVPIIIRSLFSWR